jgi:hypothetical protein
MNTTIPSWLWLLAEGDLTRLDALEKKWHAMGEPPTLDEFRGGAKKAAPKAKAASEPTLPATAHGPWLLELDGLGRPMTYNAERRSSISAATMAKVRADKRAWAKGIGDAARAAAIPALRQAFVVIQAFYPTNVVPDADGLAPLHKAAHDGLVIAGVIQDDKRAQLPLGYLALPPYTDGTQRVCVTVYPLA